VYEMVIWATDGSAEADAALEEALSLATLTGGHVLAVHCDQRLNGGAYGFPVRTDENDPRAKIRRQVEKLRHEGADIELVIRKSHCEAADVVAAIAAEHDADLIVCSTRGLGSLAGAFLGSFTQRLLHVTPCPVLAVAGTKGRRPAVDEAEHEAAHV
jgi:nucleotide-binding universal stress UspA family protein